MLNDERSKGERKAEVVVVEQGAEGAQLGGIIMDKISNMTCDRAQREMSRQLKGVEAGVDNSGVRAIKDL